MVVVAVDWIEEERRVAQGMIGMEVEEEGIETVDGIGCNFLSNTSCGIPCDFILFAASTAA